jgi:hypothetical protein
MAFFLWTHGTLVAHNSLLKPLIGMRSKQTCSSPWELSNSVLHSTCTHQGRVDSRLLMVGGQTANWTPGPFFAHNSCEAIFNIYISTPFQRYKEHLKARCFGPCNQVLSFQEFRRTFKSPFRECECHPHIPSKWGYDTNIVFWNYVTFSFHQANIKRGFHKLYSKQNNLIAK